MTSDEVALWAADTIKAVILRYTHTHPDHHQLIAKHVENWGGMDAIRILNDQAIQSVLQGLDDDQLLRWESLLLRLERLEEAHQGTTEEGRLAVRAALTYMCMAAKEADVPDGYTEDALDSLWRPLLDWIRELGDLQERGEYKMV